MENNNRPIRQCIGCRIVRPKNELLRFARIESAAPIFDIDYRFRGRGFYLCPKADCFSLVYKNKKIMAIYFSKKETFEEVKREVLETILETIKKDLKLCKRIGYSFNTSSEEKSIHKDDDVLLWCDNLPEKKVTTHTAACVRESNIFLSQMEEQGVRKKDRIVNHKHPIIFRLMVNLQKYELLSSKGPAL